MNAIGLVALVPFVIGWAFGVAAWFYGAYHLLKGWRFPEHRRKALFGGIAFLSNWVFVFSSGLIGAWFGGWQSLSR